MKKMISRSLALAVSTVLIVSLSPLTPANANKVGAACKKEFTFAVKNTLVCKKVGGKLKFAKNIYNNVAGEIRVDGSSTVTPLMTIGAEDFQLATNKKARMTVATSGTGGGFEKFCKGETDISMASRPIKQTEKDACAKAGIAFTEVLVANDGLAVVINPKNKITECITTAELKKMWEPAAEDKINNWSQIRTGWAKTPLVLYGAGADSGTFDYFTEAINGKSKSTRPDYNPSEDDNVTVNGVYNTLGGVGYFGLSYVLENPTKVKALQIDSGKGCVAPSTATVQDKTYTPLGRELFIYVKNSSVKTNPAVEKFVNFYFENVDAIVKEALFVPLTPTQITTAKAGVAAIAKL
jgi:phosphate transport system substrate-binding protein